MTSPDTSALTAGQLKTIRGRKTRAEWFAANGPCIDCESWDNLEVDHIDPATKHPMLHRRSDRVWHWGVVRRSAELAKCVVRCKPCHKAKTRANKDYLNRKAKESE